MGTDASYYKIIADILNELFVNRADYIGFQKWDGTYAKRKVSVSKLVKSLIEHVQGFETLSAYAYSIDKMSKWMCLDIDVDRKYDPEDYRNEAFDTARKIIAVLKERFQIPAEATRLEFSGNKGYHVWVFLDKPVPYSWINEFWRQFKEHEPPRAKAINLEYFPPINADLSRPYGAQVKLPLALHRKSRKKSQFIGDNGKESHPLECLKRIEGWVMPECFYKEMPVISEKPKRATCNRAKVDVISPEEPTDPPVEIARAFQNCRLLKTFKAHPDKLNHAEWTNAGIILMKMHPAGEHWFRWLSYVDEDRWDESHQDLMESVKSGQIAHMPSCNKKLGLCAGCPYRSPVEAVYPMNAGRFRPIWLGDAPEKQYVDLDTIRLEMKEVMRDICLSGQGGIYLFNPPVGTGKSHSACQMILENDVKALWYAPNNHEQSKEILAKFDDRAFPIYGRDYLKENHGFECPHHQELANGAKLGLSLEGEYCHKLCTKRDSCEYLVQYEKAKHHKVVVLVHGHMNLSQTKMDMLLEGRKLVVIDECFLKTFKSEAHITRDEIVQLRQALKQSNKREPWSLITKWIEPLIKALDNGGKVNLPKHGCSWATSKMVNNYYADGMCGRNVLGLLMKAAGKTKIRSNDGGQDYLYFVHAPEIPEDVPVFVLDTSGRKTDYEMALDKQIREVNILNGRKLKQYVHVTQVISGGYPNATLIDTSGEEPEISKSGQHAIDFIRSQIKPGERVGIISTKQFQPFLKSALQDVPDVQYAHFNKLRGVNYLENVDVLFVVGYQGIKHQELAAQSRRLFDLDWRDEEVAEGLSDEREWRRLNYWHMGVGYEVSLIYPRDPHMQAAYHEMYSEVDQAVGRIRPYIPREKQRQVFIITNVPTTLEVNEKMILTDAHRVSAFDDLVGRALELLTSRGQFTIKELVEHSGMSKRTIHNHRTRLIEHLKLGYLLRGREKVYSQDTSLLPEAQAA